MFTPLNPYKASTLRVVVSRAFNFVQVPAAGLGDRCCLVLDFALLFESIRVLTACGKAVILVGLLWASR
jgi:hypothetical protein